jgi:hypothetical protein
MKTYWGSGDIAPRILDLGTRWRWVVSFTPRPLYPQETSPWYPLDRRLGEPQSLSGRGDEEKNSQSLPGFEPRSSDCTVHSQPLYRLSFQTEGRDAKVYYCCAYKKLPVDPVLNQMNPVHILIFHFSKIQYTANLIQGWQTTSPCGDRGIRIVPP